MLERKYNRDLTLKERFKRDFKMYFEPITIPVNWIVKKLKNMKENIAMNTMLYGYYRIDRGDINELQAKTLYEAIKGTLEKDSKTYYLTYHPEFFSSSYKKTPKSKQPVFELQLSNEKLNELLGIGFVNVEAWHRFNENDRIKYHQTPIPGRYGTTEYI